MGTATRYECGFNYGAPGPMMDGGNGAITYSTPTVFSDNLWHHYVIQFGSSSALSLVQIFYDGAILTTISNVYNGTNILNTTNTSGFSVQFGRLPGFHYFNGSLDDIGIWNRPLTPCEIAQLFNSSILTASVVATAPACEGVNNGSATITSNAMAPPVSYSWTPSVSNSSTAVNLSAGNYTYMVINSKQCSYSGSLTISGIICTQLSTSIDQTQLYVFPNPTTETLCIRGLNWGATVSLYNSLGILLLQEKYGSSSLEIDLSEHASGVYFLSMEIDGKMVLEKVIKN